MTLVACVDDKNGLLFAGRRQSKDRILLEHLLARASGHRLWTSAYSASQFEDPTVLCVDDAYADKMDTDDWCFVENGVIPQNADTVILYRWNRRYPADRYFPFDPLENGYTLVSSTEFAGSSHDTITEDIYQNTKEAAL